MQDQRPKLISLGLIMSFPLPAFLSGMHRATGFVMSIVGLPLMLFLLQQSLVDKAQFDAWRAILSHPLAKLVYLGFFWAYAHHFCAGIRFFFIDFERCIDLKGARRSSYVVFAVSLLATALFGAYLVC